MRPAREGDREQESRLLKRHVAVSYPRTLVRNYLNGPPLYPRTCSQTFIMTRAFREMLTSEVENAVMSNTVGPMNLDESKSTK